MAKGELNPGYIEGEAVAVAKPRDGELVPPGQVKFGLAGKELWRPLVHKPDAWYRAAGWSSTHSSLSALPAEGAPHAKAHRFTR
jgi:hypothetical protein